MIEPVEIEHVRDHKFVKREKSGCEVCLRGKSNLVHHGWPMSFNVAQHGSNQGIFQYRREKALWQYRLAWLLEASGLPRGLERVTCEGEMTFPDRRARDQGNMRYVLEKALGDALVSGGEPPTKQDAPIAGGWLRDDAWDFYEFGGLAYRYEKGVASTRVMLFPTPKKEPEQMELTTEGSMHAESD